MGRIEGEDMTEKLQRWMAGKGEECAKRECLTKEGSRLFCHGHYLGESSQASDVYRYRLIVDQEINRKIRRYRNINRWITTYMDKDR